MDSHLTCAQSVAERTFEFSEFPYQKRPEVPSAESQNVIVISNVGSLFDPVS